MNTAVVGVKFTRKNEVCFEEMWFRYQTVREIKAQIYLKTTEPVENQILIFNGLQLPDEYTREDCGIDNHRCRVQLVLTTDTVAIKVLWNEKKIFQKIPVHVNVLSTIQQVKAQMIPCLAAVFTEDPDFREDRADPNKFDLFLWGSYLDKDSTVLGLNLKDGDEMHVLKRSRVELTVNESSQTWLNVNTMLTLEQFRKQLKRDREIPLNATIHLVGHGVMENEIRPLFLYEIKDGSRLIITFSTPITHDFTHLLR